MITVLMYLHYIISVLLLVCIKNMDSFILKENERPNIILIMADDLGIEGLGVYGSDDYNTPNLDFLANHGMRFNHAYSTPLCTPSRVQLMTGKYNHKNYLGFGLLDSRETTFANYFKQQGYETLIVGKWQLFGNSKQQRLAGGKIGSRPEGAGFNDYCLWQIDQLGSRYKNPKLSIKDNGGEAKKYPGYGPDYFVDYIDQFIEKNSDHPFLIYYPMVLPHDPFEPTPDHETFELETPSINHPKYFGSMVQYMDKLVGKIVHMVENKGLTNNTLLLFLSDNGTSRKITSRQNDHQIQGGKGLTTSAGTHVPLIAYWPGTITQGSINNHLIDFTDFMPTLLDVAGINVIDEQLDGVSFYSQLIGENSEPRQWVYCHYAPNWGKFKKAIYIHDKQWKVYNNGDVFNMIDDPIERTPIHVDVLDLEDVKKIAELRNILSQTTPGYD